MALNAPYTPNTVIQSTQVSNDLTGLSSGVNDTANNSMATYRSENNYDFVASGCVWSGDSYASTRNGSQTSGVVYIGGVRLPVASVSAHLFTASKDTYVDINGSGVQVYTEATNNAASPALAAGSLRLAIIVTGASSIANSGSVNQGQETIVLPIASSVAYSVTDSLGNLICSRDNTHKLLGYRMITASFSLSSATAVQITGLSVPVIVPTGRKIKITALGNAFSTTTVSYLAISIWDGTVGSGTELQEYALVNSTANAYTNSIQPEVVTTPTSSSKTYNAGARRDTGTSSIASSSSGPSFIKVELV